MLKRLYAGEITSQAGSPSQYWTFANSLGTSIVEYAELVVGDQTIERITGEFIRVFYNLYADVNSLIGISVDAVGAVPVAQLGVNNGGATLLSARRPYPTEDGVLFCVLPFFFLRTRLKEVFPLLSCNEGQVRIDVKLRSFDEVVRRVVGWRTACDQTPLGALVNFELTDGSSTAVPTTTLSQPPAFRDFRLVTCAALVTGSVRNMYLREPLNKWSSLYRPFISMSPSNTS